MALVKSNEEELTYKDKLIYLGIIHVLIYNIRNTEIPAKYRRLTASIIKGLDKDLADSVTKILDGFIDSFVEVFSGRPYESSIVLHGVGSMDIEALKSIGFNSTEFLRLPCCNENLRDLSCNKVSLEIVEFIEKFLSTMGMEVKRRYPSAIIARAKCQVLSRATIAFINMNVETDLGKYIHTVKVRDLTLIYFPKVLIYVKCVDNENNAYMVNDASVVGTGGELKSNMITVSDDSLDVIGIKEMDDNLYLIVSKPYDSSIMESRLILPKAYRYTLESKGSAILIHRWLNRTEYMDTYIFYRFDLSSELPITPDKKYGYKYECIPDKVFRKAGIKRFDRTLTIERDGNLILCKDNGNVVVIDSQGKKLKLFKDVTYRLNVNDAFNETIVKYNSQKIIL